jgi:hypothetical protein
MHARKGAKQRLEDASSMTETPPAEDHQVVPFPRTRKPAAKPQRDDLAKYTAPPESAEEYRQRMWVNAAVLLVVVSLIGAALWLADTMATMRRNQDCVLSGRPGCTHVAAGPSRALVTPRY